MIKTKTWKILAGISIVLSAVSLVFALLFAFGMSDMPVGKTVPQDFWLAGISLILLIFSIISYFAFSKIKNMAGYSALAGALVGELVFSAVYAYEVIMTFLAQKGLAHSDWLLMWQFIIVFAAIPVILVGAIIGFIIGGIKQQTNRK